MAIGLSSAPQRTRRVARSTTSHRRRLASGRRAGAGEPISCYGYMPNPPIYEFGQGLRGVSQTTRRLRHMHLGFLFAIARDECHFLTHPHDPMTQSSSFVCLSVYWCYQRKSPAHTVTLGLVASLREALYFFFQPLLLSLALHMQIARQATRG